MDGETFCRLACTGEKVAVVLNSGKLSKSQRGIRHTVYGRSKKVRTSREVANRI